MKKTTKKQTAIFIISLVLCIPFTQISSAEDAYFPVWEIGDTWKVKAVYPSVFKSGGYSDPVFWTYKITESSDCLDAEDCFELTISSASEQNDPGTRVTIRSENRKMVPVPTQIREEKPIRGGRIDETIMLNRGGPFVLVTGETLIPYDIPVFPMVPGSSRAFFRKRAVGEELRTKEDVTQTAELIYPGEGLAFSNDGTLIKITCSDHRGRILFTQFWDRERPWPLYGENQKMKYWLVSSDE